MGQLALFGVPRCVVAGRGCSTSTGNAEVALGDLMAAQRHFHQAAEDPGLESIAFANLALVTFESGDDDEAIKAARQLLRRYNVCRKH